MARILIFDDDRDLRDVVRTILEEAGHQVQDASNGYTGVQMYREDPTDIVITDIRMPEKTGNQAILELRSEFPEVKIIAISGGGSVSVETYMRVARKLGADRAIAKPFAPDELLSAVRALSE
jgi:DNA-binding response OmpR family regulator